MIFGKSERVLGWAIFTIIAALDCQPSLASGSPINAVGVENQYASVIQQVGGPFVRVSSIENNPNTDPHSFEVSPDVARQVAAADLIVRNGAGYDDWIVKIIGAVPNTTRHFVVDAQILLALPDNLPNPHLWYDPKTMPAVAAAVAAALANLQPAHAQIFHMNALKFDAALQPWRMALAALKAEAPGVSVAVTEPVGDDLLQAAGIGIGTPFPLQAAIMNGTDPAPQDVTTQTQLLSKHLVKALVYNNQVTDPLTASFLSLARRDGIPVVGVYETMPIGYSYQSWMLAETNALSVALTKRVSTEQLAPPPASHD